MSKLAYLMRSVRFSMDRERQACPNCGGDSSFVVERKWAVTALRRCAECLVLYRAPVDAPEEAASFYNEHYTQGFTTDLPSADDLQRLIQSNWAGEKDYSYYIGVLAALGLKPRAALFDFGCSWGYGSHQFRKAGYRVLSYEISRQRGAYGAANLGVELVEDFEAWAASASHSMDAFFSAHVLEHVPSPSKIVGLARQVLKPGGLFVAFFPNGSAPARATVPAWSKLWGEVHPNFLDDCFFNREIADRPRLFGSSPIEIDARHADWLTHADLPAAQYLNDLRGDEMFVAFRV